MIEDKIVSIALSYIGKRELKGNMGFTDKNFEQKMIEVGFKKSHAWCAYFAELVWREAHGEDITDENEDLSKLFSPMAIVNLTNFKRAGYPISSVPKRGALAIWQYGNKPQGHIGIVTEVKSMQNIFHSVEGNTDSEGGREGIEVAKKVRYIKKPRVHNGLNLLGFIYPIH